MEDSNSGAVDSTSTPIVSNETVYQGSLHLAPPNPSPQPPDPGEPD